MALFGKKKGAKEGGASAPKATVRASFNAASIIVKPIISEKAAVLGDKNVYAFEVVRSATKRDVANAVQKLWNVTPRKIAIVNRPARQFFRKARNRMATQPGLKKAYVYLKKDDRIDLV